MSQEKLLLPWSVPSDKPLKQWVMSAQSIQYRQLARLVLKCGLAHLNANANDESNENANASAQHMNQMQMQVQMRSS